MMVGVCGAGCGGERQKKRVSQETAVNEGSSLRPAEK